MFHFSKELSRTHGVPFKFVVKRVSILDIYLCIPTLTHQQGEKFSETKKRLQARLGVSDKDLAKYRFALIQVSTFKQPSYIEDGMYYFLCDKTSEIPISYPEDTIYEHQFAPEDVLGLDHVDRSGKGRSGPSEKAIVIRG